MLKFFKFLGMAIKDVLEEILSILIISAPLLVGLISALILKHLGCPGCGACVGLLIIIIGYWLYYVVPHCIAAMKYCEETNTDSLKQAWRETTPYIWP